MICANPVCRYHKPMPANCGQQWVRVMDPQPPTYIGTCHCTIQVEYKDIRRYKYRSRRDEVLYLCETCHSAAELISNGR